MVDVVKKIYHCPECKKTHSIQFNADFAANRTKYPFPYIFLHAFEGESDDISEKDIGILTTLYLDADLNIRGVEAVKQDAHDNILSKDYSKNMMQKLMDYLTELQEDYNLLAEKYDALKKKYEPN